MAASPRFNSKDQFQAWISLPSTARFLQFLADQRADLMDQWGSGLEMDPKAQFKAAHLKQLTELGWPEVAAAYGIPVEEADNHEDEG